MMAFIYFFEAIIAFISFLVLNIVANRTWKGRAKSWHIFLFLFISVEILLMVWLIGLALCSLNYFLYSSDIFANILRFFLAGLGIPLYFYKKEQYKF